MTTISGTVRLRSDKKQAMYHVLTKPEWKTVSTQFIPYSAWSNRGESEMSVWLPIVWQ